MAEPTEVEGGEGAESFALTPTAAWALRMEQRIAALERAAGGQPLEHDVVESIAGVLEAHDGRLERHRGELEQIKGVVNSHTATLSQIEPASPAAEEGNPYL